MNYCYRNIPFHRTSIFLLSLSSALAQEDNFNDGDDDDWLRFDPIGAITMQPVASYELSDGAYRISTGVSPSPAMLGPARGGSFRQDELYTGSTFFMSVDIPAYDAALEQAFGLFALIQPSPTPGTTDAYACTFQPITNDIQISRIVDEAIDAQLSNIDLLPGAAGPALRLTFSGNSGLMEARVYNLDDLSTPLATATAYDITYTSGSSGIIVTNNEANGSGRADATFDNFVSRGTDLPPLMISDSGVSYPDWATGYLLRSSEDLETWLPVPDEEIVRSDQFFVHNPVLVDQSFFRLEDEDFKPVGEARIPNPSFEAVSEILGTSDGFVSATEQIVGWSAPAAQTLGLNPTGNGNRSILEDPEIPHGSRVAFVISMDETPTLLQTTMTGLEPGARYQVTFRANATFFGVAPSPSWSLNGEAFESFSSDPQEGDYRLISDDFVATEETALLVIRNQTEGESTLLIDDFEITRL